MSLKNRVEPELVKLADPDPSVRKETWAKLRRRKLTWDQRNFLKALLRHKLRGVREDAWSHLDFYAEARIDVSTVYRAGSERSRLTAWLHYREALKVGVVTEGELRENSKSFWRLLRSWSPGVMKNAWRLLPSLWADGLLKDEERLIRFLEAKKARVRLLAWETALELMNRGLLNKEKLLNNLGALRELAGGESRASKRARRILEKFGGDSELINA
ncbi:hypothetical protein [Sulfodiicoccus acidiphilus]|uniref:hypothetical protein n=1 Tax=Sulfodiicoccus acidiphilus TaxID=1670455 RepID=UPI000F820560|nr:hypothetical protein [Sulfodiicoccus acidiphilus]